MLIPFMIFLMILSPVLIPTAVTIVNVMQGNHRPATTVGLASRRAPGSPAAHPPAAPRPRPPPAAVPRCAPPPCWSMSPPTADPRRHTTTGGQRESYVEPRA